MSIDGYPVRSQYRSAGASQLLKASTTALLSVSDVAAEFLKELGIETVLDLAGSTLFASARRIVDAAEPGHALSGDLVGTDSLDSEARGKPWHELAESSVSI